MIYIVRLLIELGYSQDESNWLYAQHISNGTLDALACFVSQEQEKNRCKNKDGVKDELWEFRL